MYVSLANLAFFTKLLTNGPIGMLQVCLLRITDIYNTVGMNCNMNIQYSVLLDSASDAKTKAHMASSESGTWLGVLPVPSLDTKLDDESVVSKCSYCCSLYMRLRLMFMVVIFLDTPQLMKPFVALKCPEVYLLF